MFPYEINPIGIVGTGVLDRPLIQQNLRTVREAGPYTHRVRLCEINHPDKPEFVHKKHHAFVEKLKSVVFILSYNIIFVFFKETDIYNRFDVNSVTAVLFFKKNAVLTDVIDKSSVAVRNEQLSLFSRQR